MTSQPPDAAGELLPQALGAVCSMMRCLQARAQHRQHGDFLWRIISALPAQRSLGSRAQLAPQGAASECIEHFRVDVALPADRRGVAEPRRHRGDRSPQTLVCFCGAAEAFQVLERNSSEHRAGPGPEILGGDVTSGDFAQIVVDVTRGHVLNRAAFIAILQQLLARQILAGADDFGDPAVLDLCRPFLAALADEMKAHFGAVDLDMAVLQRGQAIASVLFGVIVVTDPDQRLVEKIDNSGDDLLARQTRQRHVPAHLGPDCGQCVGESDDMLIFGAVPNFAETRMIEVLLAASGVAAGRLQVSVR